MVSESPASTLSCGVLVGLLESVSYAQAVKRRLYLESPNLEPMCMEIQLHGNRLVTVVYRPGDSGVLFWDDLQLNFDLISSDTDCTSFMIVRDFNAGPKAHQVDVFHAIKSLQARLNHMIKCLTLGQNWMMSKHHEMEQSPTKPWVVCSHSLRVAEGFNLPGNFPTRIEKLCNVIWDNELTNTEEELCKIEAFVPGYNGFYGEKILSKFPNLKCVSIPSKGFEHVDAKYLQDRGIAVGYAEESMSEGLAEFVLTLLLASARYIHDGIALWKGDFQTDRSPVYGQTIYGKTLGIVGMGSIGKFVAKKASGFDMKIIYHNRRRRPQEEEKTLKVTYHPTLLGLLRESDFVVLIVPLSPDTTKMIGEEQFRQMKSTATLINIGRGGLVDQNALVHALRTKQIRAAALDTTTPEPLPRDHPLLHMQNVIVTPHMAMATEETKDKLDDYTIANLMAGLRGEPLPYPLM